MRLSFLQQAAPWLAQAVDDLETATLLAPSRPYAACFYAQQAAEKAVKVIYVANDLDFPWTHSVHQLLVEAAEAYPELLPLADGAGVLDRYYVGTRYPDVRLNSTEPPSAAYSATEASRAVELAHGILQVCQNIYGHMALRANGRGEIIWYFAYGSNLDREQMDRRLKRAIPAAKPAYLSGYRLAFNKLSGKDGTGKANVMPAAGQRVWGGVYPLNTEDLKKLDRNETGYNRESGRVICPDGARETDVDCVFYVAQPDKTREGLKPSADYLDRVLRGMEMLPEGPRREATAMILQAAGLPPE